MSQDEMYSAFCGPKCPYFELFIRKRPFNGILT